MERLVGEMDAEVGREAPIVVLTSNRTRELHEALRRRCIYAWIPYPVAAEELEIVNLRAPQVAGRTAEAVVRAMAELRELPLAKPPGIAEAIDWAEAVDLLSSAGSPWPAAFRRTIGAVLKDEEDLAFVDEQLPAILERAAQ